MSIIRLVSSGGIVAIATLMLAACDEPTTAPSPPSPALGVAQTRRIPNSVKYRDSGHRPATGRSGSATLLVSALLGMNGITDVGVEAGSITGSGNPVLAKVQLAGYAPSGEHLFTINENGLSTATTSFELAGLARNARLRVHGNVRGVDGARTNVVILQEPVVLRPDIAVTEIQAPAETWTKTPTIVTAVVRELNGDVGARATCLLELDGTPVDSATNIWVDAAGTISCMFALTLEEPGTHTLTVRATSVTPGDWDAANNRASAEVKVGRDLPLSYSATASDDSVFKWLTTTSEFTSGGGYRWTDEVTASTAGRTQSASIIAFTDEPIEFPDEPLRDLRLAQRTGTSAVHETAYTDLAADNITSGTNWKSGCVTRTDGTIVATFTLCSRRETNGEVAISYTSLDYRWNAGDVTYRSVRHTFVTCLVPSPTCVPYSYTWNTTMPVVQGRRVSFGGDYDFELEFRSGLTRFSADPSLALTSRNSLTEQRRACSPWEFFNYFQPANRAGYVRSCTESREEHWIRSGSESGP